MQLVRTAKIKLNISTSEIFSTFDAYTKAFNFVCQQAFYLEDRSRNNIHKLYYKLIRDQFNLPSQLAISVITKVYENIEGVYALHKKAIKEGQIDPLLTCPISKLQSIRYDIRSYSLFLDNKIVSLLTLNKRKKITFEIPKYYQELFSNWERRSAELCIKNDKVYLNVIFNQDDDKPKQNGKFFGIDRGITNIAVISNSEGDLNKFFGGKKVKQVVKKHGKLRRSLQKKGTKSAKRHLRKLSGKERRFRADINHQISKQIVSLLSQGDTIVLEDLSGIRNQRLRKQIRKLVNNWSFFQLEQFIIYKALSEGISVIKVGAYYTSQTCSCCGHCEKANRKNSNFICKKCGYKLNADLNAGRNISKRGLEGYKPSNLVVINQPIVATSII